MVTLRQTMTQLEDGALCMRVQMPAGALGELGHDRITVKCERRPTLHHAMGILSDMKARRRGDPLPSVITVTVPRIFIARWATYDDGLVFSLTLSAAWRNNKPADSWRRVLLDHLSVEAVDGEEHPMWIGLATMTWELDQDGEVAA